MGDADHFSQSTDRDNLSDEEGVKCRESEKEVITTTSLQPNSQSQPANLKTKKTPRGKSYRKNNRRQPLVSIEGQPGYVNAAEHEEQFCSQVNLYVDYLLVKAVKELVVDGPARNQSRLGNSAPKTDEYCGRDGADCEPVFTAIDDSYIDLISEEIHSTLPSKEGRFTVDEEEDVTARDDLTLVRQQQRLSESSNVQNLSPPLLSTTEGETSFEIAAEDYMNTSFPDSEDIDDEYDSDNDVFEDVPSSIQADDAKAKRQRYKHNHKRRRKYEFEVDCETGMVFSFEIVEPDEDRSNDEYEYEDCDDCDGGDAELDDVDVESTCLVEFEPDEDSSVFRVIDENDDVEETVYMVVDEHGTDTKLAKKTSDFRARSPTKLPRAIREGTEGHRRRCYSTGDTERFESLESSSSEFYSQADTIDRILTLPSPPKSSPGSFELDDSEGGMSSSQEELEGILEPSGLKKHKNNECLPPEDGTINASLALDGDSIVKDSIEPDKCNQESRSDCDRNLDLQEEGERRWQDIQTKHLVNIHELDSNSIFHGETAYNTNHRSAEVHPDSRPAVQTQFEDYLESTKHNCQVSDEISSSVPQHHYKSDPRSDENEYERRHQLIEEGGISLDSGFVGDVKEFFRKRADANENHFEYVRGRRSRLCRREFNELRTDLAREQEAMDRMLRDAYRAQQEFIELRNGVRRLLERLESCQPA